MHEVHNKTQFIKKNAVIDRQPVQLLITSEKLKTTPKLLTTMHTNDIRCRSIIQSAAELQWYKIAHNLYSAGGVRIIAKQSQYNKTGCILVVLHVCEPD